MGIQLTLAARYLAGRRLRTLLTTLAIVFGVTVIFGLNGLLPTMMKAFTQSLVASAGEVDLTVSSTSGGTFPSDVAEDVRDTDGVAAASAILRRPITLPADRSEVSRLTVVGIDVGEVSEVRAFPIDSGRFLSPADTHAVIMRRETAERLGLGVGDTFEAPAATGTERLEVVGLLSSPALPGSDEVFVPLATAQTMFGDGERVNGVEAAFAADADRDRVRDDLQRRLGGDYSLGGVQTDSTLYSGVRTAQIAFNMFGVFALAIGGFIIFNTFRTAVLERRHDIGMLRALGASRSTVVGMFLTESLLQGVLGTALGLAGGYLLAFAGIRAMESLAAQFLRLDVGAPAFSAGTWTAAIVLGLGVTLLAGIWPAVSASRVTPLEALRPSLGEVYEKATRRRAWFGGALVLASVAALMSGDAGITMAGAFVTLIGLVLAAPALVRPLSEAFGAAFTLAFAREGRLAQSNLVRQPGRSAVTASAIMISLAIVIALLGVVTSIFAAFSSYLERSMASDLLVLPQSIVLAGGNVGAEPRMAAALDDVPGIERVATLRIAGGVHDGVQVQVAGIDPQEYPKIASLDFSSGSEADLSRLDEGRTAIVNGIFAAQSGTKAGDTIRLQTPNGTREYEVVAVGSDYLNAKLNTLYLSQEALERDFNVTTDIMVLADIASGADSAEVRVGAQKVIDEFPAFELHESSTFRESQLQVFEQSMAIYYVLLALLAVPSLLGLLNTLVINVLARTREIGMLRAVGSTRRQVRRMVLVESLLLSALGTSMGIFAGIALGYALTAAVNVAGFRADYSFPYSGILTGIAIGLLFGVVASVVPARQAAKLDVVRALRYE